MPGRRGHPRLGRFHSAANVDTLLFGSLLLISWSDVAIAAAAAALVVAATLLLGRQWLAEGFDPGSARALGLRSRLPETVLLALVAITAVAALSAVGALLATALLVVPAVTTRLLATGWPWQIATVALAAVEGVAGLWLSVQTDAPPGATIAAISGAVFVVAAVVRVLRVRRAAAFAALAAVAAALVAGGCGCLRTPTVSRSSPRRRSSRTSPVRSAAVRSRSTQLLHPNSDPHEYEPRPSDVVRTAEAKVVLVSGFGLDAWIGDVVDQGGADGDVVDLGPRLPVALAGNGAHAHADEDHDPHWWHDPATRSPRRARSRPRCAADPPHRAAFARNADAYVARLRALDAGPAVPGPHRARAAQARDRPRRARLLRPPLRPRRGRRGDPLTDGAGAGLGGEVAALVRTIRDEGVRAVFPESSVNPQARRARSPSRRGPPSATPCTATRSAGRLQRRDVPAGRAPQRDAIARGISGGAVRCDGGVA